MKKILEAILAINLAVLSCIVFIRVFPDHGGKAQNSIFSLP